MSVLSLAGLHVFPTFVVYELTVLMVLTLSVVIMKVWSLLGALRQTQRPSFSYLWVRPAVTLSLQSSNKATYLEPVLRPSTLGTGQGRTGALGFVFLYLPQNRVCLIWGVTKAEPGT